MLQCQCHGSACRASNLLEPEASVSRRGKEGISRQKSGVGVTARQSLRVFLLVVLALAGAVPAGAAVPRFDTAEVVLHAAAPYDGAQGSPNPFTDVELTAEVTAPGGRRFTVDGFFDGDGAGGQSGDVFRVRIFADEAGTWSWITHSNAAGLDGKSGSFACSGTLAGAFGKGPVETDPAHPRSFRYRTGGPVYLLGKYLDRAAPAAIRFSHTMFSEERTDADRQTLLDRHLGMGLNKVNVYLANQTDYAGVSTTPWLGSADANDKARFDLGRWRLYEQWVRKLRDDGMAVQLWFFADGFGSLPDADRLRLIRYGMARLSGSANTLFTLMTEWQEGWTTTEVESHMVYLQQHNPWDRLASVHGVPGDFSFPSAGWADYLDLQAGVSSTVDHALVHDLGLGNRQTARPVIQEEFCMGDETEAERKKLWAAFTAGAAGSGTGAYLKPFSRFVGAVPFERMAPADALVLTGSAYALAEEGVSYVVYLYDGGTVSVDLAAAAGTVKADWFDPRTGAYQAAPDVNGGAARTFTAPGAGDWALRLTAAEGNPPPPPPDPTGDFRTLTPCRLLDTRQPADGPALASGEVRALALAGRCGLPATARALSLNLTAVLPAGRGELRFAPGGEALTTASALSFSGGRSRANNAILKLSADGVLNVGASVAGGGTVDLVLDVNGWFE
jgi:hypothetical protein